MSGMQVTFLGTGTSHGVPVIGCSCPVCKSLDSKDKRSRSSILITKDERTLLIDTTPEFRLQALRANITALDAVLYTHDHADHFNGIDDLRVFCKEHSLNVYCGSDVASAIESRFSYVLGGEDIAGGIPHLRLHPLVPYEAIAIAGFSVIPIPILHGKREIFAFKVGNFLYATDCSEVPQKSLPYFYNLEALVVGALRYWPHPTHYSIFEAKALVAMVKPKVAYFTHLSHNVSHGELEAQLGEGLHVAYDMLSITVGGCNG
jgi:phosphoribosyl 1,2-cyclic phosphate phosphodiesterase